jgi:hypothetical protein
VEGACYIDASQQTVGGDISTKRMLGTIERKEKAFGMRIERWRYMSSPHQQLRGLFSSDLPEMFATDTMVRLSAKMGIEGVGAVLSYSANGYECIDCGYCGNVELMLAGTGSQLTRRLPGRFARFYPLPLGCQRAPSLSKALGLAGKH